MTYRRTRRVNRPWRPGCEGLEGRLLLTLEFPGFGSLSPSVGFSEPNASANDETSTNALEIPAITQPWFDDGTLLDPIETGEPILLPPVNFEPLAFEPVALMVEPTSGDEPWTMLTNGLETPAGLDWPTWPPVVEPPVIVDPPVIEPPVIVDPPVIEPPVIVDPPVIEPPVIVDPPVIEPPVIVDPPQATLEIVEVAPVPNSVLEAAPGVFRVTFGLALNPFSVTNDLRIDRDPGNGQWEPAYNEVETVFAVINPENSAQLILQPSRPLEPGRYRLVLVGDSMLTDLEGQAKVADPGQDRTLSEFTIERPRLKLEDATPLGLVGPDIQSVEGSLDFHSDPLAVQFYRFELPRSQRLWRFGAEIRAERDGSPLDAALALFDRRGRLITSVDEGRFDAPKDPFLFAGLAPGVYYLGVSGHGNLPDRTGGYDPETGEPGSIVQSQSGGTYRLQVVADPAGAPESLIGFQLRHADPTESTPTGFEVQFSGPIMIGSASRLSEESTGEVLEVVDRSGRTWPIEAVAYDEAQARLSFVFLSRLPEGRYSIRLAEGGGLTDLTGRAPHTPGLPRSVLATFTVAEDRVSKPANDLGPIFSADLPDGLTTSQVLGAGQAKALRFVLLQEGDVRITTSHVGTGLEIEIEEVATGIRRSIAVGDSEHATNDLVLLTPGVYRLHLRATGSEAVEVDLTMRFFGVSHESLLPNGVGQGPALNLRAIAPESTTLTPEALPIYPVVAVPPDGMSTPVGPSAWESPTTGLPGPSSGNTPGTDASNVSPLSTGTVGIGSTLLSATLGPVGVPVSEGGLLASLEAPGIPVVAMSLEGSITAFGDPSQTLGTSGPQTAFVDGWGRSTGDGAIPLDEGPLAALENPDNASRAELGGIAGLIGWLLDRLPLGRPAASESPERPPGEIRMVVQASDIDGSRSALSGSAATAAEGVEQAGLVVAAHNVPIGLSLLTVIALQFRETISRWARRLIPIGRHRRNHENRRVPGNYLAGNHLGRNRIHERV